MSSTCQLDTKRKRCRVQLLQHHRLGEVRLTSCDIGHDYKSVFQVSMFGHFLQAEYWQQLLLGTLSTMSTATTTIIITIIIKIVKITTIRTSIIMLMKTWTWIWWTWQWGGKWMTTSLTRFSVTCWHWLPRGRHRSVFREFFVKLSPCPITIVQIAARISPEYCTKYQGLYFYKNHVSHAQNSQGFLTYNFSISAGLITLDYLADLDYEAVSSMFDAINNETNLDCHTKFPCIPFLDVYRNVLHSPSAALDYWKMFIVQINMIKSNNNTAQQE